MFAEYYLSQIPDIDPEETHEWVEALENIVHHDGESRAAYVLKQVLYRAKELNVGLPALTQTPYINTIPPEEEPPLPGSEITEKRIRRMIRWNAMAMVQRANHHFPGLGGHISTYASSASLYEVGFNHFFRGPDAPGGGDQVFVQGHAAPGIYARAFLEGRLTEEQLDSFRRETSGHGLPSYPHPWLLPDFWEYPTVSMGLGPLAAVYQARFNRYLHHRGIKDTSQQRVWAFLGDGETDEPEATGALRLAAREQLDNLVFVVNCNLQRLDGPVRGNGKIIQELEQVFRGAGWHVIKVVWGPEWNELLKKDVDGHLMQRMSEVVDGQFQKYSVESGDYIRKDFFGKHPALLEMVKELSDLQLTKLRRGGHSFRKMYAAYKAATEHRGQPVVILAKTVKGWTLGSGFAGSNVTHQLKKLDAEGLRKFRDTLQLPIPDSKLKDAPYYHPGSDSAEVQYMVARRKALGGAVPQRRAKASVLVAPPQNAFKDLLQGGKVEASTTMACVRLLRTLLRDKAIGRHIVPIVPDEARTFGMDPLFKEVGIYSPLGQLYEPVDSKLYLSYHETTSGQLLEEGITEAGAMGSFTAAGTSHATHGVPMIPFYIFYSMFGLQRTADQVWAFGDARGRGFLLGATAGRTTLNGEGLQHEDGNSQLHANVFPNMLAYDPAYAYELAVIMREGLRRMLDGNEDVFYYLTVYNENYVMPPMPEGCQEGILRGLYCVSPGPKGKARAQILGSGTLLRVALEAQELLLSRYKIATDVWSVTSYQQLYREGRAIERRNRLHPTDEPQTPYVQQALQGHEGPVIATSDWVSELPSLLARFIPRRFIPLGTNGYGRSDTRAALRDHFEIDARWVAYSTLYALMQENKVAPTIVANALKELELRADKPDPAVS